MKLLRICLAAVILEVFSTAGFAQTASGTSTKENPCKSKNPPSYCNSLKKKN